jgi:hypothetical protein
MSQAKRNHILHSWASESFETCSRGLKCSERDPKSCKYTFGQHVLSVAVRHVPSNLGQEQLRAIPYFGISIAACNVSNDFEVKLEAS